MFSTCIIENYKYSNCGKWKVLGADSNGVYDNRCDEGNDDTSDGDYFCTSDEENRSRYAVLITSVNVTFLKVCRLPIGTPIWKLCHFGFRSSLVFMYVTY